MTLEDIKSYPDPMLTPDQAASAIGMSPTTLRWQAKTDPARLGFPVTVARSRTYIPRLPFIQYLEGTGKQEAS